MCNCVQYGRELWHRVTGFSSQKQTNKAFLFQKENKSIIKKKVHLDSWPLWDYLSMLGAELGKTGPWLQMLLGEHRHVDTRNSNKCKKQQGTPEEGKITIKWVQCRRKWDFIPVLLFKGHTHTRKLYHVQAHFPTLWGCLDSQVVRGELKHHTVGYRIAYVTCPRSLRMNPANQHSQSMWTLTRAA